MVVSSSGVNDSGRRFLTKPASLEGAHARVYSSIAGERIRAEIDALFGGDRDLAEVLEDVARLGARLIIHCVRG